jgi:L,D-peptidoglycan transpeptidase YkuD (ErfK/YbiS/YcfS/YnhG family)
MHIARPGLPPTDGCIALRKSDLRRVLRALSRTSEIVIEI